MQQEVSSLAGLTIMEESVEDLELEQNIDAQNQRLKVTATCLGKCWQCFGPEFEVLLL